MGFAVEMNLDVETTACVRSVWDELAARGITSEMSGSGARPHISLAVFEAVDPGELRPAVESAANRLGDLELSLAAIGMFPTEEGVVFVAPVVTTDLLEVHARFHHAVAEMGSGRWEYYLPGRWVPHCTLAFGVDRAKVGQVIEIAMQGGVFRKTRVTDVALVEFRPVRDIYRCPVRRRSGS